MEKIPASRFYSGKLLKISLRLLEMFFSPSKKAIPNRLELAN